MRNKFKALFYAFRSLFSFLTLFIIELLAAVAAMKLFSMSIGYKTIFSCFASEDATGVVVVSVLVALCFVLALCVFCDYIRDRWLVYKRKVKELNDRE